MKTAIKPATRSSGARRAKHADSLAFVDQGRAGTVVGDQRERLEAFYQRYPRRPLKPGQRGIVASLKSDRDRR